MRVRPPEMYEWFDPFEVIDTLYDVSWYVQDREDEARMQTQWALAEITRHRAMVNAALMEAIQRYAPSLEISASMASGIMDQAIFSRLGKRELW